MAEFHEKRMVFERYPIFLRHTLLHGKDFDKVRNAAFANAFFVFDDIKQEGNLYYEDKEYYRALELYEQAYSCFNWLEFKSPEKREAMLSFSSFEKIYDDDIVRKDKDYHGDDCEIDIRLNALHNILLNMCCCYMQMFHFKEALAACDEIIRLTDQSSEAYWRRSQVRLYDLKSTRTLICKWPTKTFRCLSRGSRMTRNTSNTKS
jgi:tetratricopeptide (TPR) repeat protein